jgi:phasin
MPEANTESTKSTKSSAKVPPPFPSVFPSEAPAAFRDMAEKSLSHAKDNYEKMKSAAEEATGLLEDTYASATKGATDYGMKVIELTRENTNSAFDFATQLLGAKSFSEVVELTSSHARKQFEALSSQGKELATLAQKVATEASQPLKDGMSKATQRVI